MRYDAKEICPFLADFTRSCSEESRVERKAVWGRVDSTVKASSELMNMLFAILGQKRRVGSTRIGAKMSCRNWRKTSAI